MQYGFSESKARDCTTKDYHGPMQQHRPGNGAKMTDAVGVILCVIFIAVLAVAVMIKTQDRTQDTQDTQDRMGASSLLIADDWGGEASAEMSEGTLCIKADLNTH